MPIYEYYCPPCHTVFSFLVRSMQIPSPPACPKCGRSKLEKKISRFAISKGLAEPGGESADPFANIDESKMERLMEEMAPHLEDNGSEDPRQMAHLMKKMFEMSGAEPNAAMMEAMRRMEAGEDPDQIDEEMGEVLDAQGDPFVKSNDKPLHRLRRMFEAPDVDPDLYEIPSL